jgi:hypothetical protein
VVFGLGELEPNAVEAGGVGRIGVAAAAVLGGERFLEIV